MFWLLESHPHLYMYISFACLASTNFILSSPCFLETETYVGVFKRFKET
jgi:hypothetical protein